MEKLYDYDTFSDEYFLELTSGEESEKNEQRERMTEGLSSNSIGRDKRTSHANKKRKQKKPIRKKPVILALVATVGVAAGIKLTSYIIEKISFQIDAYAATEIIAAEEQAKFLDNGLGFLSEDGEYIIKDNTAEEYQEKLGEVTPKELYAIKEIVNKEELKDVAVSIGYNNIEDYYKAHGYIDKDTKEPSEKVFNNYIESEIVPQYRQGTLLLNERGLNK